MTLRRMATGLCVVSAALAGGASVWVGPPAFASTAWQCLIAALALAAGAALLRKGRGWGARGVIAGLLLVAAGELANWRWGYQGEIDLSEGEDSNQVVLDSFALELTHGTERETVPFEGGSDARLSVTARLPAAKRRPAYRNHPGTAGHPVAISIQLKGPFLDEERWLQSAEEAQTRVGPLTVQLVSHLPGSGESLEIAAVDGGSSSRVDLAQLQHGPVELGDLRVALVRAFSRATVSAGNALEEGDGGSLNPALELYAESGAQGEREVLFARVPTFTLHPEGIFGRTLRYLSPAAQLPPGEVVQCHVFEDMPGKIQVKLFKDAMEIWSEWLEPGEYVALPWAGVHLTLKELVLDAERYSEVVPGGSVSAVQLVPAGGAADQAAWLLEGERTPIRLGGTDYEVGWGRASAALPFRVFLQQFTPSSTESVLEIDRREPGVTVRAGQPLRSGSYALYQGSRIGQPGDHHASSYRVTRDPGRPLDQAGGLICVLGLLAMVWRRPADGADA